MKTVMIVEDDEDIRNDLAEILKDEGHRVVTVPNGLEAMKYLQAATPPCIIILDLMMPIMDGWQLRLEMLKSTFLAKIPLVVLSGAGDLQREAAALGAVGYINKPFKLDVLLNLVRQFC